MDTICRTCLKNNNNLIRIKDDLLYKIESIASIKISTEEKLPKNVCSECIANINALYDYRNTIIRSDFELRNGYFENKHIQNTVKDCNINAIEQKLKYESSNRELEEKFFCSDIDKYDEVSKNKCIRISNETAYSCPDLKNSSNNKATKNRIDNNSKLNTKIYKCSLCNFTSIAYNKYRSHKQTHDTRRIICSICGKSTKSNNFHKHLIIHTGPPVACKHCGKICKNAESLRGHVVIHKGIEYKCKICEKVYKHRSGFGLHLKTHNSNCKTAQCHLCDKSFIRNSYLKKHIRSHTGERPYLCEFCKKGFSSHYALKTHKRQHTLEKPYNCEFCSMAFPQKVSLKAHVKSKHFTKIKE